MNILITGIHGFVGSNLVKALGNKFNIWGIDIIQPIKEGVIKTFDWSILQTREKTYSLLPDLDIIIHLAGKAHDLKNDSIAQEYFDINVGLTQHIYNFFLNSSADKFIFFSSVKAAADSVVGVLTEEVIPEPKGPYGESKIKAEEYILTNQIKGKSVYILRPSMIHGPGNKGNLNLLYNVVKKGIPWPLGSFDNRRSFTSIDNLCYIIDELISKNISSGIYHIGDDEPLSTNELIECIYSTLGKKTRIWKVNKKCMNLFAKIGTILHLPLNTERINKLTENYIVSNQKIKTAIGIDRLPLSSYEGLVKTIRSFTNQEK